MGNGWFHDAMTLDRIGRLPIEFTDAVWLDDGTLMTHRDAEDGNAIVEQWASNRERFTSWSLAGAPLRITSSPAGVVSITLIDGKPKYETILPLQDGDEDGVANGADAFPTDPAASVDSDGDGAPDMWNPGATASDSTLGLELDAFPNDPTCQDASHAYPLDPTVCDFARSIAPYEPDDYAIDARGTPSTSSTEMRSPFDAGLALTTTISRPSKSESAPRNSPTRRIMIGSTWATPTA